jgi:hypothetical protein
LTLGSQNETGSPNFGNRYLTAPMNVISFKRIRDFAGTHEHQREQVSVGGTDSLPLSDGFHRRYHDEYDLGKWKE